MLIPKISITEIPTPAAYIQLEEATGVYGPSNLGGFGTPNPEADYVEPVIYVQKVGSDTFYRRKLTALETQSFELGTFKLYPDTMEMGTTYPDGVYQVRYFVLYDETTTLTYEAGTKLGVTSVPKSPLLDNAVGVVFKDGDADKVFLINWSQVDIGASEVMFQEELPDINNTPGVNQTQDVLIAYEGYGFFFTMYNGNQCLVTDIGAFAELKCDTTAFRDIDKRQLYLTAIPGKFNKGYYYAAQELVDKLLSYCNIKNCGC